MGCGRLPGRAVAGRRDRRGRPFATKPELAEKMIGRAVKAGVPFSWVAADEVYGATPA
jgi:SRSO17 transposase